MEQTMWKQTQEALSDLDFPATKEEVVAHAVSRGGSEGVVRLLRALPLATYQNIGDLRSSVSLDQAVDDGQTAAEKATQARTAHSHRVAEHLRIPE
jgi:hypothetical protein